VLGTPDSPDFHLIQEIEMEADNKPSTADLGEPERLRLCVQASYRIESLARVLRQHAADDTEEMPYLIESITSDIEDLAGCIMEAAGDATASTEHVVRRFYLHRTPELGAGDLARAPR
jgi:hypothetical protein